MIGSNGILELLFGRILAHLYSCGYHLDIHENVMASMHNNEGFGAKTEELKTAIHQLAIDYYPVPQGDP